MPRRTITLRPKTFGTYDRIFDMRQYFGSILTLNIKLDINFIDQVFSSCHLDNRGNRVWKILTHGAQNPSRPS